MAEDSHLSSRPSRNDRRQLSDSAISITAVVGCIGGKPGMMVCSGLKLKP